VPDPFAWHPEPELIGFRDPARARGALEAFGKAVWDASLDYLYDEATKRPVVGDAYPKMRRRFFGDSNEPARAPTAPSTSDEVLREFRERVAPYVFNSQHPGAFSYFTAPPLPVSIGGEVLSQWLHQGVDVWAAGPVGALVEEEVTSWLRELVGSGDGSWGVLTSGGVMANVMAMTVARDVHLAALLGLNEPPRGRALESVRVYASDQTHFSIARGLDVLGFPRDTLRVIASDDAFRLHGAPVEQAISEDRDAGLVPFAISAVSGSTNTGSVDLVGELADVAERNGLWLHVDAAYGGAARLSSRDAHRVPDLERADSVTIDPHKWFFQGYDIGGLVVKRRDDLLKTFRSSPEYYRSPKDAPLNWYQYTIEGTRRFRALKLWLSWKHLGTNGFGRLIEHTNDLAAHMTKRCRELGGFDVAPREPELSVVCFRHVPPDLDDEVLDAYQDGLQRALEVDGTGMGLHDAPPWSDASSCRHRELPLHARRRRCGSRGAPQALTRSARLDALNAIPRTAAATPAPAAITSVTRSPAMMTSHAAPAASRARPASTPARTPARIAIRMTNNTAAVTTAATPLATNARIPLRSAAIMTITAPAITSPTANERSNSSKVRSAWASSRATTTISGVSMASTRAASSGEMSARSSRATSTTSSRVISIGPRSRSIRRVCA
jgi:aromatic-L-amino-acid decarboxylase